jgi:hypothetical protein
LTSGYGIDVQVRRIRFTIDSHVKNAVALAATVNIILCKTKSNICHLTLYKATNGVSERGNS